MFFFLNNHRMHSLYITAYHFKAYHKLLKSRRLFFPVCQRLLVSVDAGMKINLQRLERHLRWVIHHYEHLVCFICTFISFNLLLKVLFIMQLNRVVFFFRCFWESQTSILRTNFNIKHIHTSWFTSSITSRRQTLAKRKVRVWRSWWWMGVLSMFHSFTVSTCN